MKRLNLLKTTTNITIKEVFKEYEKHNILRNLSPQTITHKQQHIKKFYQFIYDDSFLIKDVDKKIIDEFACALRDEDIKPVTVNTYLRNLRAFLNWCSNNDYMQPVKIGLLKVDEEIKETYSETQLKLLLEKPNIEECSFPIYRTWVLINYLLSTGNRLNTIVNIKIADIDLDNELIYLKKVKNRKQQIIPLSHSLCVVLKEYLSYRQGEPDDYLFCSIYGEKLTKGAFEKSIAKYNIDRGVNITSIHTFRHSFAKFFIKNGGDVFRLQKLMGHSDISVTRIYVDLYADDIKENYEKFNPLDVFTANNKKEPINLSRARK